MIRLYVLDFDDTLIPYDSWGLYLRELLKVCPVRMGFLLLLRELGLLSRTELKRRVTVSVVNRKRLEAFSLRFVQKVAKDIQLPPCLFEEDNKAILILSASPMCYMRYLGDFMACHCDVVGSDFVDGEYIEMHGEKKHLFLKLNYPRDKYQYVFAMSDSDSDLVWMKEFEHYELIKTQK